MSESQGLVFLEGGETRVVPSRVAVKKFEHQLFFLLGEIGKMFADGNLITLVVRNPGIENGDLVVSSDVSLDNPIASILNHKEILERERVSESAKEAGTVEQASESIVDGCGEVTSGTIGGETCS